MKTQKEISKEELNAQKIIYHEKGCKDTFIFLCVLAVIMVFLFLVSCRPSICPAYTSSGTVYYPFPNKHVEKQLYHSQNKKIRKW